MTMQVHARISKEWRRRMLFMFAMLFGCALWFLTDGYIIWPKEAERYEAYAEIRDEMLDSGKAENEESEELRIAWKRYAREADVSEKIPKERTPEAIQEQLVIGWFLIAVSLTFGGWVVWNHRLSIRAEGNTVIGASGQEVDLDSIIATDRKKWKNKGIAYAIYEEGGKQKRLCLDDHKFAGAEEILLEAERRIKARAGESEPASENDAT
ncbi:hypothetical protein DDZ13_00485 [Coraliomargarita sinensis]|uniref:Uncharacterized protein n=2 Tax=Coraliomargarita sinensis TaxID=2174842 RepID=A0A317ZMG7_9BACT|nr:hypothetical protein DDZ13_00485 [Coraliomargarita sinensis]